MSALVSRWRSPYSVACAPQFILKSVALRRNNSMSRKGCPTTLRITLQLSHPSASGFLPPVQRRKAGILLFLSPIQILSSEILCLILLPAASADSSARESRGDSSRNGHSNIMTERLLTKKSRQLWSSHSTMPDKKNGYQARCQFYCWLLTEAGKYTSSHLNDYKLLISLF